MNVLVVGLGSIGRKHVKALRSLDQEFKIYALRSDLKAEKEVGIVNIFTLEDVDLTFNFAIICNPTHLHSKSIEELALKNIPLIIEKPILDKFMNIGYFYFKNEILKIMEQYLSWELFLNDIVKKEILSAYVHKGVHITVNTIEELYQAKKNIENINFKKNV